MRSNEVILLEVVIKYLMKVFIGIYVISKQVYKYLNQFLKQGKVSVKPLLDEIDEVPAIVRLRKVNLNTWFDMRTRPEDLKRLEYKPDPQYKLF